MTNDTKNSLIFDEAFAQMEAEVERKLSTAPPVVRNYTLHLTKSKGKFIRAYALLCCAMDAENQVPQQAVNLAAAIELLHLATLVHDDVIDNADTRRGVETLQKKFGKKTAVICGDYLLALALKMAGSIPDKEQYTCLPVTDYVGRLCMGELRQEINNGNLDLSVYRYLSIINGKTAALFEASFYGGALLTTKDQKILSRYKKMGRCAGMIFQLMDDCIDYEMEEDTAGKTVRSDFEEGVVTLPLIYTMQQNPEFYKKVKSRELGAQEVYPGVRKAGGPDFTRKIAGRYYKKAMDTLETLSLTEEKKKRMKAVLDKSYYGAGNNSKNC